VRIVEVSPLMREMIIGAMRWPISAPLDETGEAYFAAFARLCSEWIEEEARLSLPTTADGPLTAAMAYTRAHLAGGDVASASRAAGLSERTLRRRFSAEAGLTGEDYRRRARLLAAVDLLTATRKPVGVIAAEVGFESQSAFAKAFRALLGRSPQDLRKGAEG